jgi:hypothetical protein
MNKEFSFKQKFDYALDKICSKGLRVMILWLSILSIIIILIFALFLVLIDTFLIGHDGISFWDSFWISLIHTLDASALSDVTGWRYRLFLLPVTLAGVFLVSALIGVISTWLETRIDALRRGRSKVIEKDHTVILGWNDQVFTIIQELATANKNLDDGCIVIMGQEDKVSMEEQIHENIPEMGITRIVCRTGSPLEPSSLNILSLNTAKSIIVLSPQCEDPDSEVIKICLAIIHQANRSEKPFHIVAELRDEKNLEIGAIIGGDEVEWILTKDIISRMIAQTCHQTGLSTIYTDLMDFAGDEIYFYAEPNFIGKPFGDLLNLFKKNAVMGIWKKGSAPHLNPSMNTPFEEGDQLFLLAADDDRIFTHPFDATQINEDLIQDHQNMPLEPEKILLLGWNGQAGKIIREINHYIQAGSEIVVVADKSMTKNSPDWENIQIKNASIHFQFGNTSDRQVLEQLTPHRFKHIIILSYSGALPHQAADAKTLITLLHLRDIANKCGKCQFSIVTEMLDVRNRNLAEVTKVDDFIISNKMISLLLSQVAERKLLNGVFRDILGAEGSEVYLKPVTNYISLDQPANFYTIVESARRKNELAIGYKIHKYAYDADRTYGIVLNPNKADLCSFEEEDQLIVLSETF